MRFMKALKNYIKYRINMRLKVTIAFIIFGVMFGCKENSEKKETGGKSKDILLQEIEFTSKAKSQTPYLVATNDDLYLSWQETENDTLFSLKYSKFDGKKFTDAETITTGDNWFVNWADYPVIAENDGVMLANTLQKSATGTYTYDVMLNLKSKEGNNWSETFKLHQDTTQSEHGFVSMIPFQDKFFVTWLDGRNTVNVTEEERAMNLRGAFVDAEGHITGDTLLDDKICDCCQTTAAMTSAGPVVIYRDRSDTEVRDMNIVRYVNGTWTQPNTVHNDNWEIAGCPVNGPRADAQGDNLAVAWFASPNENSKVLVAFSKDAGETFQKPTKVDLGNPMGRVDLVLIDDKTAIVSWLEGEKILARKVSSNGMMGKVITISQTSKSRASGFPQMELFDGKLYFAWTMVDENRNSSIQLGVIKSSQF